MFTSLQTFASLATFTCLLPICHCFRLCAFSRKTRAILKATGMDGSNAAVPTSVQEIVAARIDALDATVGLVLKVHLKENRMKAKQNETRQSNNRNG